MASMDDIFNNIEMNIKIITYKIDKILETMGIDPLADDPDENTGKCAWGLCDDEDDCDCNLYPD